jgi:hypothetical protein
MRFDSMLWDSFDTFHELSPANGLQPVQGVRSAPG